MEKVKIEINKNSSYSLGPMAIPKDRKFIIIPKDHPNLTNVFKDFTWDSCKKILILKIEETKNFDGYRWFDVIRTSKTGSAFDKESSLSLFFLDEDHEELAGFKFSGLKIAGHKLKNRSDDEDQILHKIEKDKMKGKVSVTRFKGLGEMNPSQLRESAIAPDTRRLLQLSVSAGDNTHAIMDMLLAKKRASERKSWLQDKGDLAVL